MKNISFTQFSVRNSVCKACAAINLEKKYVIIYIIRNLILSENNFMLDFTYLSQISKQLEFISPEELMDIYMWMEVYDDNTSLMSLFIF